MLNLWSDQRLEASQDWDKEIRQAINSAGVAVLLVSQDFLNSKYTLHGQSLNFFEGLEVERQQRTQCLFVRRLGIR